MDYPLVSVVIPTYSRPIFLKRCIESVFNQTYKNIEIIVVDDNDPDSEERLLTKQVMEEFSCCSNVVYILHDRNKNGSAARNTGWRHSKALSTRIKQLEDVQRKTMAECDALKQAMLREVFE